MDLASKLDTSAPDGDSHRLGALIRLSAQADDLHNAAEKENRLESREYKEQQESRSRKQRELQTQQYHATLTISPVAITKIRLSADGGQPDLRHQERIGSPSSRTQYF